jgi:ketol-acid reductoisomerase
MKIYYDKDASLFNALRKREAEHPVAEVGKKLRSMMAWLQEKKK